MGNDAMKPRTRLAKFLAKIAGLYDGEIEPKTELERRLNDIAVSGDGNGAGYKVLNRVIFDRDVEFTESVAPTYVYSTELPIGDELDELLSEYRETVVHVFLRDNDDESESYQDSMLLAGGDLIGEYFAIVRTEIGMVFVWEPGSQESYIEKDSWHMQIRVTSVSMTDDFAAAVQKAAEGAQPSGGGGGGEGAIK